MPTVKTLPAATKTHLRSLVTDSKYRNSACSSKYNLGGPGSPGKPIKKFGWNASLPSGAAEKRKGQDDAGKYRLGMYTKPSRDGGNAFWYKMTHVGDNSYKFEPITGFPVCGKCRGTGDVVCPDCGGAGRTNVGNLSQPCRKCMHAKVNKRGFITCECGGNSIANGSCVVADASKW